MFEPSSLHIKKSSKPSDSPPFPLQAVVIYVETNASVRMFEDKSVESRQTVLEWVKHSLVTREINDILEAH